MNNARKAAIGFLPIIIIALVFGSYLDIVLNNTPASSSVATTATTFEHPFLSAEKTYDYDHIPYIFAVGNFSIHLANNATFYVTHPVNGTSTEFLGWVFAFNVTTPDKITNYPYFLWGGPPCPSGQSRSCTPDVNAFFAPYPTNATVNFGSIASLLIQWNVNATGLYVSFIQYENNAGTTGCYQGPLPTNYSTTSGSQSTNSRTIFNITQEFNSWSWAPLSTFRVGSYIFVTTAPTSSEHTVQLEPQLFFNVTNGQGQTQTTSVTNLGGWNGQVWPPDMSLEQTLFGGKVTIQWLFLCNSQSVLLEITTK